MDFITHSLFAYSISNSFCKIKKNLVLSMLSGAVIPDIGEIFIQQELAKKYGATIAVYDERTSDALVASNLKITFLYDILHSFILPFTLIILSFFLIKNRSIIQYFAFGIISHIFLDSFTHGKIWELKLLYPLINTRFVILSDSVGNWWDWSPKVNLIFFKLPIYCILIWIATIFIILIQNTIIKKIKRRDSVT